MFNSRSTAVIPPRYRFFRVKPFENLKGVVCLTASRRQATLN
jgi:hypothetical protein